MLRKEEIKQHSVWGTHSRTIALSAVFSLFAAFAPLPVDAQASNYEIGHITRVSYLPTGVLIMMDGTLPTNCAGTGYGWMMIASSNTGTVAFTTGLWMRGDASQWTVVVYTAGIDSTGYCQVNQLDTQGNGG